MATLIRIYVLLPSVIHRIIVISHNIEQHCGFGSALPQEELHIIPEG